MKRYYTISKEDVARLAEGGEVEVVIGKRVRRTLTIETEVERKKRELREQYEAKLAELGG